MYKKKLIEVALPLEAINKASQKENNPFTPLHPKGIHPWWARRTLATCRAVLFASLVDDPSSRPEEFPSENAQEAERQRLFRLIEQLVKWENSTDERILGAARHEIMKSTGGNPPPVYDPFCGGGSIPLEAQRLGLEAHGSDLNPVAVMITKAMIEIPPKFAGNPPVNPTAQKNIGRADGWKGAGGLAEDIRFYGQWMRKEAEKSIGKFYPKVKLPPEQGGGEANAIAWLWARTVKCPNPACGCEMPLVRSFALSMKKGKEAWVEPIIDKKDKTVRFKVKTGKGKAPEGTVNRRGAKCICCDTAVPFDHLRKEGKAGRMGDRLLAIVAEGTRARVYVSADAKHEDVAKQAKPFLDVPDTDLPEQALGFRVQGYGMTKHRNLFTSRQLVALTTLCKMVGEARERVLKDAQAFGLLDDGCRLNDGGTGAAAYADAVATYLGLAISKMTSYSNNISFWNTHNENIVYLFARQAIPMSWDFVEPNIAKGALDIQEMADGIAKRVDKHGQKEAGFVFQSPVADSKLNGSNNYLIATDPPYYDNIGYADLSDFFYVWLRQSIGHFYPDVFSTIMVPKKTEIVATPFRFDGDKVKAQNFFRNAIGKAFDAIRTQTHPMYPMVMYYAFKQSETDILESEGLNNEKSIDINANSEFSTGWETMLHGLLQAKFTIVGTWPMHTERPTGVKVNVNALASSIVLVCRPRPADAQTVTRKEFLTALRRELPSALKDLRQGNIAPVDLAQATVGPGMAVFSQYAAVLEANGAPMPVRTALQIINQELDAWLTAQEGVMDQETRFCVAWYEQFGLAEAAFGEADVLARAKNTAVQRLDDIGLLSSSKGKVRLLTREELPDSWIRSHSSPVWLCTQHLVKALATGGEVTAAKMSSGFDGTLTDAVKSLTYRLYAIADRKKQTEEALAYNALVASWSDVQAQAMELTGSPRTQGELF